MNTGYCCVLLLLAHLAAQASSPPVQLLWDKSYGGSLRPLSRGGDLLKAVLPLPDGGLLLAGDSGSAHSAGKTAPLYGGWDIWVVRLDADGNQLWDQSYGGTNADRIKKVLALQDGGFFLAGESTSCVSGSKTSCTKAVGTEWWLVRIDAAGRQLWDVSYGTPDRDDYLTAALALPDGGFLLGGWHTGSVDYVLRRLDGSGREVWSAVYDSGVNDGLYDIVPTADGGFLLCGTGGGVWLVRVDGRGRKLWERKLREDYFLKAIELPDGGFAVGSRYSPRSPYGLASTQPSPSLPPGWGEGDYWLFRLDAQGGLVWGRPYGGDANDLLSDVQAASDGGFWLGGESSSGASGNKTCSDHGGWLVRLDGQGSPLWDRCLPWTVRSRLMRGLDQELFLFGVAGGVIALTGLDSRGLPRWQLEVPVGQFFEFGRTSDGAFYEAGFGVGASNQYNYRAVKIGPAPIPAAQDSARLLPLRDLQGDLRQDGFLFSLVGVANTTYITEYSANLRDWTPFATNHVGSVDVKVRDLGATNAPERYYRARKQSP